MKLKISTVVEIDDKYLVPEHKYESAVQFVFDDITNYVTCRHYQDVLQWLEDKSKSGKRIADHHRSAAELCSKLKWEYEEVKE